MVARRFAATFAGWLVFMSCDSRSLPPLPAHSTAAFPAERPVETRSADDTAEKPTRAGASESWWSRVRARLAAQSRAIHPNSGSFVASLPLVGASARFDQDGAVVTDPGGGTPLLSLALASWGREGDLLPVEAADPTLGACTADDDPSGACIQRLEYVRGPLIEWWVGLDNGLEQGFTLSSRPLGAGPLAFEVVVEEALGLDPDNDGIAVTDASGRSWTVGSVLAWDSNGNPLLAWLETDGSALEIIVDDAGAAYPVTVDPIYTSAAWTLLGSEVPSFGACVAGAGDVNGDSFDDVLVNAKAVGRYTGAVYVYHGSSSGLESTAALVLTGSDAGVYFGFSAAGAGDVNGDSFDDVIVGAFEVGSGQAFLFSGSASGLGPTPTATLDAPLGATSFGRCVAGAGDVDADGYDDVIVGAYGDIDLGKAYVYNGSASGLPTTPTTSLVGPVASMHFGYTVSTAGDVNGDGYDDVVVGDYEYASEAGWVGVYLGSGSGVSATAATELVGTSGSDFGKSVGSAGDVNADGFDDVIVGADATSSDTGSATVFHGSASGLATSAATTLTGTGSGDYFGTSVAGLGDVNGDGYDDVVVGSEGYGAWRGHAEVHHGSALGVRSSTAFNVTGSTAFAYLGCSVAAAGDNNGDGYADLIVGAEYADNGEAYGYLGSAAGITSAGSVTFVFPEVPFEAVVSNAGDVNGDGYADAAVGCPACWDDEGRVYVYHGSPDGLSDTPDATLCGSEVEGARFGYAVDAAGDVNGDGYGDLIVGEPSYVADSSELGRAYVFQGTASGLSTTAASTITGTVSGYLGTSVAGAADVNGDGYDDVVVGAYGFWSYTGDIFVFQGSADGLSSDASAWLAGTSTGTRFGYVVATAGDVNGDGFDDIAVTSRIPYWPGRVQIYHGSLSGIGTTAVTTLNSDYPSYHFGCAIAFCDVNGDGYDDLVAGAYGYSSDRGRIYVFEGGSSGIASTSSVTITGTTTDDYLGEKLDCAGDVDADGYDDVIVGLYRPSADTGQIRLYNGSAAGLESEPSISLAGPAMAAGLGYSVAGASDVNGDGFDDVLVGGEEFVWLFLGYVDADSDGSPGSIDCDDSDATVYPGANELCDGIDNDCDGTTDESDASDAQTWYRDADSDGYGLSTLMVRSCTQPSGYVSNADDCDDDAGLTNPGATESCNGVDDDCDGDIDESGATGEYTWHRDSDGDGYGSATASREACTAPAGYVANATDCNDSSASVHPGASETCDNIDDDCDGSIDEGIPIDAPTWYLDADDDGYGSPTDSTRVCTAPSGYVADGTDCDDSNAAISPAATESCNDLDDDCDGDTDEIGATGERIWYRDADDDGFGLGTMSVRACDQPTGYVANSDDCDDGSTSVSPVSTEICDSIDDDCDGEIDESGAVGELTWYRDADEDGFGSAGTSIRDCTEPEGYVSVATDCDDTDATVHPGAAESCDGLDDDCDGSVDEGSPADAPLWHLDADGDGYGSVLATMRACTVPPGYVEDGTDCDDRTVAVNPSAAEWCDAIDNDCDGEIDEDDALGASTWYADADGDSFTASDRVVTACQAPIGYAAASSEWDCDDTDAAVNPSATETCNSIDDDCDGETDEAGATNEAAWYPDADGDSFPGKDGAVIACDPPAYYLEAGPPWDCDDADADVNPAAAEDSSDGEDDDCDGMVDETDDADDTNAPAYYGPDATVEGGNGCGCAAPVRMPLGAMWLAGAFTLLVRRRRR